MMQIGVRAHDYPSAAPGALFCAIAADGWQTVQLAFKKAIPGVAHTDDITPALLEETRAALSQNSLSLGVLGVYVEPSLADPVQRRCQVEQFCAQLPFARALSAGCVATETTALAKQPGVSEAQALDCLRLSLAEMLPAAEAAGVTIAIEPVRTHTLNSPERTRDLLREMASDRLKVVFDPVNLLSPQDIPTQHSLWQRCFACFGEHIAAVHIKGSRTGDDNMQPIPLWESVVDYEAVFAPLRALGRDIPVLREVATPADAARDIAFIKQFI